MHKTGGPGGDPEDKRISFEILLVIWACVCLIISFGVVYIGLNIANKFW